jgi:hypothetical protein
LGSLIEGGDNKKNNCDFFSFLKKGSIPLFSAVSVIHAKDSRNIAPLISVFVI